MTLRIAINGFGRIGRTILRCILADGAAQSKIEVVAINTGPHKPANLDILFSHDSVMGIFPGRVTVTDEALIINGTPITLISLDEPEKINWKQYNIDWVIDASGFFTDGKKAHKHCLAGAKKVLITAPATNEDVCIVPGVNDDKYSAEKHNIVSLGSCTTNCFAPVVKVLHETFGINEGLMTTVHAYTNDQVLLDIEHHDPRRARAAAINIIPTKTGADKVIAKIFPDLEGKIRGSALRVPVPVVSMLDFTFTSSKKIDANLINNAFEQAANSSLKGILEYTTLPLVSSDFIGNPASCILDSQLTQCVGQVGKIFAWYDNEYGYSCRVKDFLLTKAF